MHFHIRRPPFLLALVAYLLLNVVQVAHVKAERFPDLLKRATNLEKCKVDQSDLRSMSGFGLGTSLRKLKKKYQRAEFLLTNSFGFTRVFIDDNQVTGAMFKKNIERIELGFVGDSLAFVKISFKDTSEWPNLASFISEVSPVLGVPSNWDTSQHVDDPTFGDGELICEKFRVFVSFRPLRDGPAPSNLDSSHGPTKKFIQLTVTDTEAQLLVRRRMKKRAETYHSFRDSNLGWLLDWNQLERSEFFGLPPGFERLNVTFKEKTTVADVHSLVLSYNLPFESIRRRQNTVYATIYIPRLYERQWLGIFEKLDRVQSFFVQKDRLVAYLQGHSEVQVNNRHLLGAANVARPSADIRNRISGHFRQYFASKGAVSEGMCGPLCLNFIVRNLRGEILAGHNYWERLKLQVIFVPKSESVDMYFIIEGKYAAGLRAPLERNYTDMENEYYEQLSNYLNQLSTSVHGIFN